MCFTPRFRSVVLLLAVVVSSPAAETAGAAFETVKSFNGTWSILSDQKTLPIDMVYEPGSKGSIVTERFGKELSVFYQDHGRLQMIHFCNAGNQPRLALSETSTPSRLLFEATEVINLARPDAAHVQRIIYTVVDPNKTDLEIVWMEGRSQTSEKYRLLRHSTPAQNGQ